MLGGRVVRKKERNKEKGATHTKTEVTKVATLLIKLQASSYKPVAPQLLPSFRFFSELIFRISPTAEAWLFAYHYYGHRAVSTGQGDRNEGN
jgi:hypothetical protein